MNLCISFRRFVVVACFLQLAAHLAPPPVRGDTVALMIGNNAYQYAGPLRNPVNDVSGIARKFKEEGVAHEVVADASRGEIVAALNRLRTASVGASVVMFYFAGHGFEAGGQNYLVPIDARKGSSLIEDTISVGEILETLGECGTSTRFLVLDCCRNDPFAGVAGGLAEIEVSTLPPGVAIIYSGAPGKTVPDGRGDNSPFAAQVINNLVPGHSALHIFTSVAKSMEGAQKPWMQYDGALENMVPLCARPLLAGPLATGDVNLSLLLRIIENYGEATEREYEQRRLAQDPDWTGPSPALAKRARQRVLDIAKIYVPNDYYGPNGVAAYLDAEIALAVDGMTLGRGSRDELVSYCLALQTFEGVMVKGILTRALGSEESAVDWLGEHGLEY